MSYYSYGLTTEVSRQNDLVKDSCILFSGLLHAKINISREI